MSKRKYKNGDVITMTINQQTLDEYNKYYFAKYPRRRKEPIDRPTHPSINKWFILKRPAMNQMKANWKEFIVWFVENQGLSNLNIKKCSMKFTTYFKTKIRNDVDNTVPKFALDGLVMAGLIVDDDYEHLRPLILDCGYDKNNSRTEIEITIWDI